MSCCISVYVATTGCLHTQHSTRHMTDTYGLGNTHTNMSTCTFLTQMLCPGVQGDLGTIQSCVHMAAAAFILLCLSRSFKTNPLGPGATGFDCPAWAHRWFGPVLDIDTHYGRLVQVLMIQTQQGSRAFWKGCLLRVDDAGQRGEINGEELPGEEEQHKTHRLI